MGDKSKIEWTDATWNPLVGCSLVIPGCTNCYAMKMAARVEKMARANYEAWRERASAVALPEGSSIAAFTHHYEGLTQDTKAGPVWTGKVASAPDYIFTAPLKWRKPRRVFVNSMSDLFHESVPHPTIERVFAVMALSPQHTYQVLTKRSEHMRRFMSYEHTRHRVTIAMFDLAREGHCKVDRTTHPELHDKHGWATIPVQWPLPNVWLGVSAEDQQRADERIPDLLNTPAAIRFVSAEPLLGAVTLTRWFHDEGCPHAEFLGDCLCHEPREVTLDWIIVGGESGTGARPMHPDWARSIRDQCEAAGVPFFLKQWGEFAPRERCLPSISGDITVWPDGKTGAGNANANGGPGWPVHKVGKARAGRLLDGREHNDMPVTP